MNKTFTMIGFWAAATTALAFTATAEASTFKVPTLPLATGVVCNNAGVDVIATSGENLRAAIKINAYQKLSATLDGSAAKNGNIVSFVSNEGKLDIDFERRIPGSDAVIGELDVEIEGQRLNLDIPCRLLFLGSKKPILPLR